MAWSGKNHLDNLEEILMNLQWLIQPDTVITELPFDLDFLKRPDVEIFAEWCPRAVSKQELEEGRYTINKYLIKFFIDRTYPQLSEVSRKEKIDKILEDIHKLLKKPKYEPIYLNAENIEKILEETNNKPGETHVDKTKRRIKVAVSLRWLQHKSLFNRLSEGTQDYIRRVGDLYGLLNKNQHIDTTQLHNYSIPQEDLSILIDDYETKIELTLLTADQEIKKAKQRISGINYNGLGIVREPLNRIKKFIEKRSEPDYDELERFKDSIFITIILNYIKDPYIQKTQDAKNVINLVVPIYVKFKNLDV
ncbi:MAG: hypothetical protein N3A65_01980 [candidate division WOR-3 bacterium]|nr:hypothetical protein [candidate division WOR-3 bacterium]